MFQPNRQKVHFFLIVFSAIALGLFLGRMSYLFSDTIPFIYKKTKTYKILELIRLINERYVDHVNTDSIVNVVLTDVLRELDPHSTYFTKDEYRSVDYEVQGHYQGIGISFNKTYLDTPVIIRVLPNSPAQEAGIIPGDMIMAINGDSTVQYNTDDLINIIAHTRKLRMDIKRVSTDTQFTVELKKKDLVLRTVFGGMTKDSICYVKIISFGKNTYDEFMEITEKCKHGQARGMILDLRDNTGGMLATSTEILEQFFPRNTLLFYLKSKQEIKERYYTKKDGSFLHLPLVVLINEHTASASELIAGAVQDNDRGVIIGSRSFGKGLVQSEYHFPDGSVVRLTTSKYYTPSGRCLQRPYDTYYFTDRDMNDSLSVDSTQIYYTKNGRKIYGGGGVIPDIWVKDTLTSNTLGGVLMSIKVLRSYGQQIHDMQTVSEISNFADTVLGVKTQFYNIFSLKYNLLESRFVQDSAFDFYNSYSPVYHKAIDLMLDKKSYDEILSKPQSK